MVFRRIHTHDPSRACFPISSGMGSYQTSHQGSAKKTANIFGKFGVPNPVTGSQPVTAVKPGVPHP